ncbi:MAG: hypothetical protein Q8934_08150 [Bacillota bacterium]|nr:hypothetical protein [Bacillota bacterium]
MKQKIEEMRRCKKGILEDINHAYLIKPITVIIVLIGTAFILGTIYHTVKDFEKYMTSDFVGALINLLFAWNLGFGLYQGIWRYSNPRRINKVLFPKLEQFINKSTEKCYEETETEVHEMIKIAYTDYTEKYNKLNKLYWKSIKISFVFPIIALVISLVFHWP